MANEFDRDAKIKTRQPRGYTMTSMQVAKVVNVMHRILGFHPSLGEVIHALVADEQINATNPRAKKRPQRYWEHAVTKELQPGGALEYVEERKL